MKLTNEVKTEIVGVNLSLTIEEADSLRKLLGKHSTNMVVNDWGLTQADDNVGTEIFNQLFDAIQKIKG